MFYNPEKNEKLNFFLGVVKDARFLKTVTPGDQLIITAESLRLAEDSAYVKATATVNEKKVSQSELIFVRIKK